MTTKQRRIIKYYAISLSLLCLLGVCCLFYAYFIEPQRLVINEHTITLKDWDPVFDGYKIVAIGDIHGGSNGVDQAKLRRIVAEANAQNADLIVLLGDYVSQKDHTIIGNEGLRMPIGEIADGLAGLSAKDGVLAVLGNHDGWFCDACVKKELTRVGINVLENDVIKISRGQKSFRVIGLPDHLKIGIWTLFSGAAKGKLAFTNGQGPVIALEHSPDVLPVITGDLLISPDLKLLLSAHTHGGQVWFPIVGSLIVPTSSGQKYAFGEVSDGGIKMFVTTGIGESVLPLRFMVPPEIAVLTIKREYDQ